MTGWIDFFVLVHSDTNTECWEFDHAGWRSPPESARYRVRVDKNGARVIVGANDAETGALTWVEDDEPWQEFEEAAYHCIDRYFAQDCIVHRYDFQREVDRSSEWELDGIDGYAEGAKH